MTAWSPSAVVVGAEVAAALADGRPVVALESAIITHGLPRPLNLEVAMELEDGLRAQAVVPATVAVIGGVPTVGLSAAELKELAGAGDVAKVSVGDLAVVMARHASGGTTVAATAWLAHRVGIGVFATGGIGGVHRGAAQTFDESSDLPTLARTPITVVCAGVKSILDVPATLERLETLGVTVVGFRTRLFPGFYVTDSGSEIAFSVDGPDEVVAMMAAARALGLPGGLLVANPIPGSDQLDPAVHDTVIAQALASAATEGIRGPAITPYLLDRLCQATAGASLAANVAAVRNNVTVAGRIALAWSAHG